MARIRTIKPDFWTDERLVECSPSARLLFLGMLNFADDYGNLRRSSKKLHLQILPNDDVDCEALLQELMEQEVVVEYDVCGETYLHIKGFLQHQKIDKPSKSQIPAPEISESAREHSESPREELLRKGKGREKEDKKEAEVELPSWMPLPVWEEFLSMRHKIKKPPTAYAKKKLIEKLDNLRLAGDAPQDVLENSIINNWQDVYAIKRGFAKVGFEKPKKKNDPTSHASEAITL